MGMLLESYGEAKKELVPGTDEWLETLPGWSEWQSGVSISGNSVNGGYCWMEKGDGSYAYCWDHAPVTFSAGSIQYIGETAYAKIGNYYYFKGRFTSRYYSDYMYAIARATSLTPA